VTQATQRGNLRMPDSPLTQRDVQSLRETLDKLDRTIENLRKEMASTYVRQDVYERDLANIREDVKQHSDWLTWAQRIVIGAVLLALLGLVVYQGGAR
jgi:tetrahydromethanopterin S-methyltransferase subunit B